MDKKHTLPLDSSTSSIAPNESSTEPVLENSSSIDGIWDEMQGKPSPDALTDMNAINKKFLIKGNCGLQWLSHEGSLIVSALIGVSESEGGGAWVYSSQLPSGDRDLIDELVYAKSKTFGDFDGYYVRFDGYKNFIFRVEAKGEPEIEVSLGNRVSSIPPNEASRFGDVKVERRGKEILIGNKIKLERNRIQNLVQPASSNNNESQNGQPLSQRQKVSGRNAYEIRADILENAIDVVKYSNTKQTEDVNTLVEDILDVASKMYEFVENRK